MAQTHKPLTIMLNYLKNLNRRTKNTRGWLIGGVLLLYLFPFYSLAINKWSGWSLGELYTLGLELKDFLTVWTTLGGVVAVVIGIIQTQVRISQQKVQFEKQQEFQQKQFDAQRELQLKEQRDARFASGVELLGNPHESTRIGGAYNLYFLAREFKDDYLNPVCEILCAHLRSIAHKDKFKTDEERTKYPRNEVQSIIDLLFKERDEEMIFKDVGQKDLQQIFLSNINFEKAELGKVDFMSAELRRVSLKNVKLNEINFGYVKLNNVVFWGVESNDVMFQEAKLNNVTFFDATLKDVTFENAKLSKVGFLDTDLRTAKFLKAKLNDVSFRKAKLNNVDFGRYIFGISLGKAELNNVDFSSAQIVDNVNFEGTRLEGHKLEGIVKPGHSLELTSNKEPKNEEGQEENAETSISG